MPAALPPLGSFLTLCQFYRAPKLNHIKNISALYLEAHTLSHTATRLKGDRKVNLALDNRLERESAYKRKKSVTVEAESIYKSAICQNTVQAEVPGTTPEPVLTL